MIVIKLDELLAQRKMKSTELAERLGYTVQTVSRIKTGKVSAFRLDTLNALCEVFDCQPADILEYVSDEEARRRFDERYVDDLKRYQG